MATIFPIVERDAKASTAPSVTIQLQSTPLMNAAATPRAPNAAYPSVLACAIFLT